MSRPELIKQLKKKNKLFNEIELKLTIDIFCNCIREAVKNRRKVEIRGFGTFFTKTIKEKHYARNPKSGELLYIPEKNKVRFRAGKNHKKKINENT